MKGRCPIAAITIPPSVKDWLREPTAVSLLHIFDRAINLIETNKKIISIVQPSIGPGPFSIVVDVERPFPTIISPQDPVNKTTHSLQIGPLQIDLRQATLWQPRPHWHLLREKPQWLAVLPELQTAVNQNQHRLTAGSPVRFAEQFFAATTAVQVAIIQPNNAKLETAVTKLAGFGPGFTPAGDDFLVGFLFGLWATRPKDEVEALAKIVVETAVSRTTQLAAAWLQAAVQGEAALPWHNLANALLKNAAWETEIKTILNTGATSGIAALMGFLAATTKELA